LLSSPPVKFKPAKLAPAFIAAGVIVLVCGIRLIRPEVLERIERMTYDQRVRWASHFPQPSATNLGVVFVTDDSIAAVNKGLLGKSYGLYWPRHIYARVLRELAAQGANTVAYDVLFGETRADHAGELVPIATWGEVTNFLSMLHPDEPPIIFRPEGGEEMVQVDADDYLAWQLRRTGIGVLAADQGVLPHPLFATNALALGDIGADRDADGVLRRARAFRDYRRWHSAFQQVEADPVLGVDLRQAKVEPGRILLPRSDSKDDPFIVPLDRDGNFDLTDFALKLPVGAEPKAKPFATERVWHMGIVLASRELNLDLSNPQIDLARGRITLNGANGVQRILPVDANGYFNINWEIPVNDPRLLATSMEELLKQDMAREDGQTEGSVAAWKGKLVIVGSSATGNDLTDVGVTPLEKNTFLISKHWNVANSIITGRFVRRASVGVEFLLIALLGALTAAVTWRLRVLSAAGGVIALMIIYWIAGVLLYVHERYWLPLVLPVIGAMLMQHVCLVTYRVVFEQSERRRVKSIFSHMVSPNIVNELITQERLPLGGARREVTVFFADVRGFTALTDTKQQQAENYVREHELAGDAAEAFFDEQARETLNTVNLYLALVADIVKKHEGTLDKYIGDCVMAFWGAPTPNPKHALACVRAAIDAQRAIHEVNQRRMAENQRMEADNVSRAANEPLPLLPTLSLGTGINTGTVTVGLMGSEAHIRNYTAFGREVNLASRLEGVSGHGRIVISETTYQHLLHDDPELAATCIELEPTPLKGFQKPIRNFEVPWKTVVPSG
jgi:class 3 adenylate cyclase